MTHPCFLALYVVWHPSYLEGRRISDQLSKHFRPDPLSVSGKGQSVSVLERSTSAPGAEVPPPIDWDSANFTAAVVLMESNLVDDHDWVDYVHNTAEVANDRGIPSSLFPVTIEHRGLKAGLEQQALRWDLWDMPIENRLLRLTSDLTHEFCHMLRHHIRQIRGIEKAGSERYLRKIQVFISHSKHDDDGESVALDIRNWIHTHSRLDSFFDIHDIPPGFSFKEVILNQISAGAVVAVHTDSYSSREWCFRHVLLN